MIFVADKQYLRAYGFVKLAYKQIKKAPNEVTPGVNELPPGLIEETWESEKWKARKSYPYCFAKP